MKDRELLAKSITTKDAVSDGRESPSLLSDKLSRLPWSTLYASVFCAGVLLLPFSGQAVEPPVAAKASENKNQLKTLQQDIAEKEKSSSATKKTNAVHCWIN